MPQQDKKPMKIGELPTGLQVILFILTLGILYFFKQRQSELEKRANIRNLIPDILQAIDAFRKTQVFGELVS